MTQIYLPAIKAKSHLFPRQSSRFGAIFRSLISLVLLVGSSCSCTMWSSEQERKDTQESQRLTGQETQESSQSDANSLAPAPQEPRVQKSMQAALLEQWSLQAEVQASDKNVLSIFALFSQGSMTDQGQVLITQSTGQGGRIEWAVWALPANSRVAAELRRIQADPAALEHFARLVPGFAALSSADKTAFDSTQFEYVHWQRHQKDGNNAFEATQRIFVNDPNLADDPAVSPDLHDMIQAFLTFVP